MPSARKRSTIATPRLPAGSRFRAARNSVTMVAMIAGKKILITGPAGQIAFPMAQHLAADNEVWGLARFTDPASRQRVEGAGVRAVACDLASGDFDAVP